MREATMAVQRFWDARPCNIRHSDHPVGSREWSDEVTKRKYFVEPHIPGFAQFDRWNGKTVLEIGCGIGTDTLEFYKAGTRVYAVDISRESINIASKRGSQKNVFVDWWDNLFLDEWPARSFHCLDAEENLPPLAYDLVYSFGVLHHTPRPEKILWRCSQLLKDDGELRIMLYSRWSFKRIFHGQPEAQAGCPIVRFYTPLQATILLEECGFAVESITKAHIFPWRIKDYVNYRYVKRWQYRWMPGFFFRWLERHFGEHLLIVARKA